jgi:DNA-binding transcriptional LysR family regulator
MRLKALKAFIVLAENNCNFIVHKLLGIPRSNLWAYIDEIEEELGVKLIERRRQLNTFTPEGLSFIPEASKIARAFEDAKNKISQQEDGNNKRIEGTIVVSTTSAVANAWLMESIKDFHSQYPNLKVHIFVDDKLSKEIENSADILLRPLSEYSEPHMTKKWYIAYHHGLFASKAYLKQIGTPQKPEDLLYSHSILSYGEHEFTYFEDINWHIKGKYGLPRLTPTLIINSTQALYKAAGEGIGICSAAIESNPIYGKNLVRVLPQIDGPTIKTYFAIKNNVSHMAKRNTDAFRVFFEQYLMSLGVKIYHEETSDSNL